MRRLLYNGAIRVPKWYEPAARDLLQHVVDLGLEVCLATGGTKPGFGHQLRNVSLAHRRREIPVAWTWTNSARRRCSATTQRALLAYIHGLLLAGAAVTIMGDTGFGAVAVLKQLDQ